MFGPNAIVLVATPPFVAAWCVWVLRLHRAARQRWKEWRARTPVADGAFLRGCDVAIGSPAADVAIAVRRVLGTVRGVPPETIRADDAFADHFWDSLDWLDVTFRIENS